jgi:CRISPR/Cas system-associated exonuclease Cas4 (RecB family)
MALRFLRRTITDYARVRRDNEHDGSLKSAIESLTIVVQSSRIDGTEMGLSVRANVVHLASVMTLNTTASDVSQRALVTQLAATAMALEGLDGAARQGFGHSLSLLRHLKTFGH